MKMGFCVDDGRDCGCYGDDDADEDDRRGQSTFVEKSEQTNQRSVTINSWLHRYLRS